MRLTRASPRYHRLRQGPRRRRELRRREWRRRRLWPFCPSCPSSWRGLVKVGQFPGRDEFISCAGCGWNSRAFLNILIVYILILNNVTGSGSSSLSFLAFLALLLGGPCESRVSHGIENRSRHHDACVQDSLALLEISSLVDLVFITNDVTGSGGGSRSRSGLGLLTLLALLSLGRGLFPIISLLQVGA